VGVVGRDLHGIDRDHADARVLQLADQLGQIALDLVGHPEAAVGETAFVSHECAPARSGRQAKTPPGSAVVLRAAPPGLQRACHFLDLEDLELVAFLDVVVVLELDTALEAFLDLAHVVLLARSDSMSPV
jgi:hypothetical protein